MNGSSFTPGAGVAAEVVGGTVMSPGVGYGVGFSMATIGGVAYGVAFAIAGVGDAFARAPFGVGETFASDEVFGVGEATAINGILGVGAGVAGAGGGVGST